MRGSVLPIIAKHFYLTIQTRYTIHAKGQDSRLPT
jgi:hypothetical protein